MPINSPVRLLLILACLLFCGTGAIAQDDPMPSNHTVGDHDDHAMHGHSEHVDPHIIHQPESFLAWFIRCMGLFGPLVLMAGLACLILTLVVVLRGNGPFAFAALLLVVPIPFLIGLCGTLHGIILSLQVISTSNGPLKAAEVADFIGTSLINPLLGMMAMVPSYSVAVIGSILRSFAKSAAKP